jgi:hypothetical protein
MKSKAQIEGLPRRFLGSFRSYLDALGSIEAECRISVKTTPVPPISPSPPLMRIQPPANKLKERASECTRCRRAINAGTPRCSVEGILPLPTSCRQPVVHIMTRAIDFFSGRLCVGMLLVCWWKIHNKYYVTLPRITLLAVLDSFSIRFMTHPSIHASPPCV